MDCCVCAVYVCTGDIEALEEKVKDLQFPNLEDGSTLEYGEATWCNAVEMVVRILAVDGFAYKRENKTKVRY